MRVVHIGVSAKGKVVLPKQFISTLPKKVGLFMTAQFLHCKSDLKKQLIAAGLEVKLFQPIHTSEEGQILGCSNEIFPDILGFVVISDGSFHPQALLKNKVPIFVYDPFSKKGRVIHTSECEQMQKKLFGKYSCFLMSKTVGVITSLKSGQYNVQIDSYQAETRPSGRNIRSTVHNVLSSLRQEYPDKKFYSFVSDEVNLAGMEDFPFLDFLVNTACPRIADDYENTRLPLLNLQDIRLMRGIK